MPFLKAETPIRTTGNNLVGLWRPSFVKVDHRLFVYGGGGNVTNDLHVLNLNDLRWETVQSVKGKAPCKRYGHTATLWNNKCIIVFGGCNEFQEYCNDVSIFDIEKLTWIQPEINGIVPARYLHSASVYDNKLFIYGGFAKNSECTFVLDELDVLDLQTWTWSRFEGMPPRYNHSATLVGHKMYIYAGKDEQGNTVSDLFVVNLNSTTTPYTPHLVLSGSTNSQMVLLKSQHFCESICGKLLVFGRYLAPQQQQQQQPESMYGLWMLDLDTLVWERQECHFNFNMGGWNYFTILSNTINNLFFLGNTDPFRPQGYDHFRDALIMNSESLGLYDIQQQQQQQHTTEFSKLLNNSELSDFVIVTANGRELYVHQVILMTRWPHFKNICKSGMIEAREKRMEIPEPYEVVFAFLKYLYDDYLDENEPCDIVCQLLVLANMYVLDRLKKICCDRLYRYHLSLNTCVSIFEKAIATEEIGLKSLTLDFMFRHLGYILKSNILIHMPATLRMEFLEAIPEEAILQVHHNKSPFSITQQHNSQSKLNTSSITAKTTTTTTTTTTYDNEITAT